VRRRFLRRALLAVVPDLRALSHGASMSCENCQQCALLLRLAQQRIRELEAWTEAAPSAHLLSRLNAALRRLSELDGGSR